MLIFKKNNINYVYIHIPKNCGKFIRKEIKNSDENEIIKSYWDCDGNFDLAHIPYMLKNKYILNNESHNFFTYTRNPYYRVISAYFYVFSVCNKSFADFQQFVIKELNDYNFKNGFNKKFIHFYPQYLFVCDENYNITADQNMTISKIEDKLTPRKYDLKIYFTEEVLKIVNKIYENDFLFFGYEMIESLNQIETN
jgi:hypothetical protein